MALAPSIITGSCVDTSADHSSSCVSVSINGFLSTYIIASGAKINRLKFLLDKGKRNWSYFKKLVTYCPITFYHNILKTHLFFYFKKINNEFLF